MYTEWFQLSDRPFSITPDPRFLFLSERHREALAHLLYGVTESGGFIQLTGEVGMGKTTLTRTLLEQLPDNVDAALVYNAHASLTEFLEAICDEFGVRRSPQDDTPKRLTDALNTHLLEAHARGRRPVLIVDEAQNLGPDLLEQVRLLTNLETHREKLLQILLIGQPELRETLARNDLRQLAQRITARYHLEPLDAEETRAYVRHRLEVAGARRPLFTRGALNALHRASGGIPRLINILAERALLGAFAERDAQVTAAMVRRAVGEVRGASTGRPRWGVWAMVAAMMLASVALLQDRVVITPDPVPLPLPQAVPVAPVAEPTPAPGPDTDTDTVVDALPRILSDSNDLSAAAAHLLERWQVGGGEGLPGSLCTIAQDAGLACSRGRGTWNNLRTLDRPALLELRVEGRTHTVLLTGVTGSDATLWTPRGDHTLPLLALDPLWFGDFLLLWRPPVAANIALRPGSRDEGVLWLREALANWQGHPMVAVGDPAFFDTAVELSVRDFQHATGLEVDGIAGEQTLVHLDGLMPGAGPRLSGHPAEDDHVVDP